MQLHFVAQLQLKLAVELKEQRLGFLNQEFLAKQVELREHSQARLSFVRVDQANLPVAKLEVGVKEANHSLARLDFVGFDFGKVQLQHARLGFVGFENSLVRLRSFDCFHFKHYPLVNLQFEMIDDPLEVVGLELAEESQARLGFVGFEIDRQSDLQIGHVEEVVEHFLARLRLELESALKLKVTDLKSVLKMRFELVATGVDHLKDKD